MSDQFFKAWCGGQSTNPIDRSEYIETVQTRHLETDTEQAELKDASDLANLNVLHRQIFATLKTEPVKLCHSVLANACHVLGGTIAPCCF